MNKSVESGGEEATVTSANVSTSTGPCIQPNIALGGIQVSQIGVDGELVKANALIDEGSDSSLATTALVRKLSMCGAKGPLHVSDVVGRQQQQNSEVVKLRVASPDSRLYDVKVWTLLNLSDSLRPVDWSKIQENGPHLKNLTFSAPQGKVDLLIGIDHSSLIVPFKVREGKDNEPYAVLTKLGWVARGNIGMDRRIGTVNLNFLHREES